MNEWEVTYIYNGQHTALIMADTIDRALAKFRELFPEVPGIGIDSIICLK